MVYGEHLLSFGECARHRQACYTHLDPHPQQEVYAAKLQPPATFISVVRKTCLTLNTPWKKREVGKNGVLNIRKQVTPHMAGTSQAI